MADRDALLALADRTEREEPSRELDKEIAIATGSAWQRAPSWLPHSPPLFTGSLDAAVALEPADAQEVCVRKYPNGGIYVRLTDARGVPFYFENFEADRPIKEPMARLAVYLRARAAIKQESTNG